MDEDDDDELDFELELLEQPPRPLSPMKVADIMRVAKRMWDDTGFIELYALRRKCVHRIPGSLARYQVSVLEGVKRFRR
jgi:hypothetical protein